MYLNLGKRQEINERSRKLHDNIESIVNGNVLPTEKLLEDIRKFLYQQRIPNVV